MNFAMIGYVLGWVFNFEAVFLLLPALVGLVYREPAGWGFLLTAGICLLCGCTFCSIFSRISTGIFCFFCYLIYKVVYMEHITTGKDSFYGCF